MRLFEKHRNYFKYVVRHKWYVFVECCKLGIPWRGIIHDWSKFLPCEWRPYAEFFYGGPHRSWTTIHGDLRLWYRYEWTKEGVKDAFDAAWLHHQHVNKHHWQHWVLRNDDGDTRMLRMPDKYMREMLADWRGAGRALGKPDTAAWYEKNRDRIMLHPVTREWIEDALLPVREAVAA